MQRTSLFWGHPSSPNHSKGEDPGMPTSQASPKGSTGRFGLRGWWPTSRSRWDRWPNCSERTWEWIPVEIWQLFFGTFAVEFFFLWVGQVFLLQKQGRCISRNHANPQIVGTSASHGCSWWVEYGWIEYASLVFHHVTSHVYCTTQYVSHFGAGHPCLHNIHI